MDFQGNIVRGRVEGLTPYKNILNPLFDKLTDKSVDRVIVVGGGAKSPKIQVYKLTRLWSSSQFLNFLESSSNTCLVFDPIKIRQK